jgi:purine catabolism regulator
VLAQHGDPDDLAAVRKSACFDTGQRLRTEKEPEGLTSHHRSQHVLVPIVAGRVDHGRLIAFAVQRPFDAADVDALERAATVAALAVTKDLAVSAVEDKYRADYLRDLLTGRLDDPLQAASHCASLGWDIDGDLVVVVAELDPGQSVLPATQFGLRPVQERFVAAWHTVVQQRDASAPVAGFNQEVVVVLKASQDTDTLVRRLIGAVSGGGGGGRRTFSTGVSRPVRDAADLPTAYEEARRAVRMGRRLNGHGSVANFDSLGVYRLLSLVPDAAELRDFATETLKTLAREDDPDAADLRLTLEVLLDLNLNVAEAARRLHFHYNTLRYRIGKIERLVGPFMERADLRLDLTVALRILHMRGL